MNRLALIFNLFISCLASVSLAQADPLPIKIGVIAPLTHKPSEDMGLSIVGGANVFVADMKITGGVLGRPIEIVIRDDQANPDIGVSVARELVEKEKVVAIVGIANAAVAMAAGKYLQEAKVPTIISASAGAMVTKAFMPPEYPSGFIFRVAASDEIQPLAVIKDILDKRKLSKIAILHDQTAYGNSGRQVILSELQRRSIKPVSIDSFKVGETDFSSSIQNIRESGADVVILHCLASDAANVVKALDKAEVKLPVVGSWTLSQRTFTNKAGKAAEGVRMAVTYVEEEASSVVRSQFLKNYLKINNISYINSGVAAAQTYDALRLLAIAIFQAGSTEPLAIQAALENLKYPTTSTIITRYNRPFSPKDHEAIARDMVIVGEVKRGKIAYAYEDDMVNSFIMRTKGAAN